MKRIFIHNALFRIIGPPVYGMLVYLLILLINNSVTQLTSLLSNQEVYVSIVLSLISFESMRLVLVLLERYAAPWEQRIIPRFLVVLVVSVAVVLAAIGGYYRWVIGFDISYRELVMFGSIFGLTALLYYALYIGNRYLQLENTVRIEQEHKLKENLEHEFASFRQEINPDLLYDSLEELILCLHNKTDVAEELIDSLAALYRYQLVHRQKEFVPLDEELQAARHLLRLLNQKHRQQIRWTNNTQPGDIQIMPGALLTAIDSVTRNTLISADKPLTLTLAIEEDDYFVLHHLVNDKLQLHAESMLAFRQLQRSYSVYTDRPFVQVKAGRENYIKFPMIRVEHQVTESA